MARIRNMVVPGGAGGESSSARAATPRADPDRRWSARDKATRPIRPAGGDRRECGLSARAHPVRSEEHTSALQSLMRNSYAGYCLKKKQKHKSYTINNYKDIANVNKK